MSEHDTRLEETRISSYVYIRAKHDGDCLECTARQGRRRLQDRWGGRAHAEV